MKELDFLPYSYVAASSHKRHNQRNTLMSVGLVLAMVSLHILNVTRIRTAEAALSSLHNGTGGWQSAQDQLTALEFKKSFYRGRINLLSRLDDAAPLDAAIGEITRLLNDTMAFRSLTIDTQTPPNALLASMLPPAPSNSPSTVSEGTHAVLAGVAVSDVDVGIFLGKLSTCPLFQDVTLSYSRETRSSGRLMREFEVRFTLRPVEATP